MSCITPYFLASAALFTHTTLTFAQRVPIQEQLTFTPYHANGIYETGETVGWIVAPGPVPPTYAYKWTVRRNNAIVLAEGKLDLSAGKDKIEVTGDQPEMIYVAIEPYAALAADASGVDIPAGGSGQDAAANTPVESEVPGVEASMFSLDALGSKAHGYLARPAREGRFPAVIQLQYAGVYALNLRGDEQRAAEGWLIINVDSHDKLPSDPSGNIPRNYQEIGNTDREKSYFLDMYLRDSRALDYLMTRPDWDGKTIVLMGGSMGGQQSIALAGLRPEKLQRF